MESIGVGLESCSDPVKYADYLSGKASQGLTEKMWLSDYRDGVDGFRLFFPEEFVISGDIDMKAAEALFGRKMNPTLLWAAARQEDIVCTQI